MLDKVTQGSTLSFNEDLRTLSLSLSLSLTHTHTHRQTHTHRHTHTHTDTHSRGTPKDFIFNFVMKDSLKQCHILSDTKRHNVRKFNSIQKTHGKLILDNQTLYKINLMSVHVCQHEAS